MKIRKLLITLTLICSLQTQAQDLQSLAKILQEMTKETNPAKNVRTMKHAIKTQNLDPIKHSEEIDIMKGIIALSYLDNQQLKKFEKYIDLIKNKFNQTSYQNMASDKLINQGKNLVYAESLAEKTALNYQNYKNDPSARPKTINIENWNRFMQMAAYPYYVTYAKLLAENGKPIKALSYLELAFQTLDPAMAEVAVIELYASLLEKNKQIQKSYEILLKMATIGKANSKMIAQLSKLHLEKSNDLDITKQFVTELKNNVREMYKKEVAAKMIDGGSAPNFELINLDGDTVKLQDFKGKIVLIDFWATWCAPCIASLPTLETLSKKHTDVVFLFISTQETGTNIPEKVKEFIKKSHLDIQVLLDLPVGPDNSMYAVGKSYQIKGIPAKMLIDKKGKLRFSSEGFTSVAELTNELEAMISIANSL
ncbi:MAG: TlpA family protein disulfide reductase [Pedobacter sp.]|nr:MAG: TlpA family protein disulfide reductase [Pedobacter sp.]